MYRQCSGEPLPSTRADSPAVWTPADLGEAILGRRGAGQLLVRYQPVVATMTAEPLGVEALVRWRRPGGALVAPDDFVGVAEQAGLGGDLDQWVLREALTQIVRWDAAGIRVHRVAVNLGRTSLVRPDLVEVVLEACQASGAAPQRLAVEVLEHHHLVPLLGPAELGRLQELADLGVTLALDDFGSGFAGLDLVRRLPLQLLKLDRDLVQGNRCSVAPGAPSAEQLLAGVVALASAVGAEVTAEGVETSAQRQVCARLGVEHLQGWLFSAAVDAEEVVSYWNGYFSPSVMDGDARPRVSEQVSE